MIAISIESESKPMYICFCRTKIQRLREKKEENAQTIFHFLNIETQSCEKIGSPMEEKEKQNEVQTIPSRRMRPFQTLPVFSLRNRNREFFFPGSEVLIWSTRKPEWSNSRRERQRSEEQLARHRLNISAINSRIYVLHCHKMFDCGGYKSQYIGGHKEKFVRYVLQFLNKTNRFTHSRDFTFHGPRRLDDLDSNLSMPSGTSKMKKCRFNLEGLPLPFISRSKPQNASKSFRRGVQRSSDGIKTLGRSLRSGVSKVIFPEDLKVSEQKIFDPQDKSLLFWNKLFVLCCILAVSVDPLFFYLPVFNHASYCLGMDTQLAVTTTTVRTAIDVFYLIRMAFQFRTAYIAPSSRVFGRGELVIDPTEIAQRYLQRYFVADFLSVLPLPQVGVS